MREIAINRLLSGFGMRLGAVLAGTVMGLAVLGAPVRADSEDIAKYLDGIRTQYGLPALAAAVAVKGEVVAAGVAGVRVQGGDLPVTLEDRFHLGSNTKAMTATLAAMLVEEGKLRWDSTIAEVLGGEVKGLSDSLGMVTLTQLLSHSSGLPSDNDEIAALYFSPDAFDYTNTALRLRLLDAYKAHDVVVPEGSPFQYSNLGYVIAGAMVEKASGQPWELLMHERLFGPLGLKTAGLGPQTTLGRLDAPAGHRIEDDGTVTPMLWGIAADVPEVMGPAGNAHMSVLDNVTWAAWNAGLGTRGPKLISEETAKLLQTPSVKMPQGKDTKPGTPATGSYGLGWGAVKFDWSDKPLITHNGSNSMNLARVIIDQDRDIAIVVMTNFPGPVADKATGDVMRDLYTQFAK